MPARRVLFVFFALASTIIVGGVAYPYLRAAKEGGVPSRATATLTPAGASVLGLRGRAPATVPPAPVEAAALRELIEKAPEVDAVPLRQTEEPLKNKGPVPLPRLLDLASAIDLLAPPSHPADWLTSLAAAPAAVAANDAVEALVSAPLPPPRPRDLLAEASQPSSTRAAAEAQAALATPPPRPRDLVVTATPPQASAAQEIAAHAAAPSLREAPEASAEKSSPPPRFTEGAPAYVRIFKRESELELWLKVSGRYALYRTFPICKWSGRLGPKTREADYQSPEGFYSVSAKQLNPRSNYHLAFNVGYPNVFDRQNGRTGGLVMVHGNCKSVGCFAMTDRGVDEIYRFVAAALTNGQREVPVHIFPFRMTEQAIAQETGANGFMSFLESENSSRQWTSFWNNLKEGYDIFEHTGEPPTAYACGDHYAFGATGGACPKIAGW